MSGIYQIYNPVTNKRYIGSSINVERRFKEHIRNLRANRHCNQHLQNAWNKYPEQLIFELLEVCEPTDLLTFEQYYIDYYKSYNRNFGYNIDRYACHSGNSLSDETKLKISQKHKGKKVPRDIVEKIRLANTGKNKPRQSQRMKELFSLGKSTFPRYNQVSEEKQRSWSQHLSESIKRRYSDYRNRPKGISILVSFDNGTEMIFPSKREAARNLNVDKDAITYAIKNCNGRLKKIHAYVYEKE